MSGWGYFFLFLLVVVIIAPISWIVYTRIRAQRAGLPPPPLSSYNPFSNRRSNNPASQIYPASSGVVGWVKDKFYPVRDRFGGGSGGRGEGGGGATRAGAYEQTSDSRGLGGTGGRRGRGLDPDEAWDTRVGAETDGYGAGGYYEEQELGLTDPSGHNRTQSDASVMPDYGAEEMGRGRSMGRDMDLEDEDTAYVGGSKAGLDRRYDEEMHGGGGAVGGRGENPFGDGAERSELRGVSPRPHHDDERDAGLAPKGKEEADSPTERRSMFRESL